jgi:hypothetical protein
VGTASSPPGPATPPPAGASRPPRWRLAAILLGLELVAAASFLGRGFPYFGSGLVPNATWLEIPLALAHLPAIGLLSATGLCCGFRNGLVLGPVIRGGHIPMTPTGTVILAAGNWLCWLAVLLLAQWAWTRRRGRAPGPPGAAST